MPVTEINHYFVRANDLEQTKNFYCDVLGFQVMPRPSFPFPGYWLGVNGKIQVHMGPDGIANAEMYYLGTPKNAVTDHAGVVDHIAFVASEPGQLHPALQGARRRVPAPLAAGVRSLPDLHQGPQRPHHRAELLRPQGRHRLGRRGLLEDAAGRDAAGGRDARVTARGFTEVGYDEAMRRAAALVPDAARARRRGGDRAPDGEGDAGRPSPRRASSASTSPSAGAAWSCRSWRCSTFPPRSRAAAPPPAGTSRNLAHPSLDAGALRRAGPGRRSGARIPTR